MDNWELFVAIRILAWILYGALALGCLVMLCRLCFQKSKSIRRIDFFGIMAAELLIAYPPLTGFLFLGMCLYVLLVLFNVVLAVLYLRKLSKANREMKKNGSDTIA